MENTEKKTSFLSLRNLEKVYPNGEKAVYDFNLEIEKNEFIVIVGPSGCGKSTTLRMLAGLEDITDGEIFLNGELLNYKPSKDRGMAVVFQSYALYPQMNVYDNIAFPLTINQFSLPVVHAQLNACRELQELFGTLPAERIAEASRGIFSARGRKKEKLQMCAATFKIGLPAAGMLWETIRDDLAGTGELTSEAAERWKEAVAARMEEEKAAAAAENIRLDDLYRVLDEAGNVKVEKRKYTPYEIRCKVYETADKLDLVPYLDKLPKELSGGQMQRVALGRAIIKNVPIFLMDEPLSNLDAKLRLTMRSEIVKLHNRINATTVYVTHDQTEAMTMATRIVVMSKGFVQQISTPEEVYNNPVNLFVARFMGSPAMNIFEMRLDRGAKTLSCGELTIPVGDDFIRRHDAFYAQKAEKFSGYEREFGEKEREEMRKILSVTGEGEGDRPRLRRKNSILDALRRRPRVKAEEAALSFEKKVAGEKFRKIGEYASSDHPLIVGIRPEKIRLEKRIPGQNDAEGFIVRPTVCELLGGEYNVHFDFFDRDIVGQIGAEEKISPRDEVVVRFPFSNIYIFDPVTGDRIL